MRMVERIRRRSSAEYGANTRNCRDALRDRKNTKLNDLRFAPTCLEAREKAFSESHGVGYTWMDVTASETAGKADRPMRTNREPSFLGHSNNRYNTVCPILSFRDARTRIVLHRPVLVRAGRPFRRHTQHCHK